MTSRRILSHAQRGVWPAPIFGRAQRVDVIGAHRAGGRHLAVGDLPQPERPGNIAVLVEEGKRVAMLQHADSLIGKAGIGQDVMRVARVRRRAVCEGILH